METNGDWDVGTEGGFIACYRATFAEVYAYAGMLCGHDRDAAEDLVHDVYLTALHRARGGELTTATVGYFITSVRRRHIDRWRSSDRERQRLTLVHSRPSPDGEPTALPPAMLAALNERERAAVVLRYVDDLPVAEIAEQMGLGVRAAESLLSRAIRRLRREEARDA